MEREPNHTSLTLSNRITLESDWLPLLSQTDGHHAHYSTRHFVYYNINLMIMTTMVLNKQKNSVNNKDKISSGK